GPTPRVTVLTESVPARQPLEPSAIAGFLPLQLQMPGRKWGHPDDRAAPAAPGVGDPYPVSGGHVLDAGWHAGILGGRGSRLHPSPGPRRGQKKSLDIIP